jgi:hypothetical protein
MGLHQVGSVSDDFPYQIGSVSENFRIIFAWFVIIVIVIDTVELI